MSRLWLKGARCQCTDCGLHFTSVREFDRHRAGGYAKPGEWKGERYCRTLVELVAEGWREDDRGFLFKGRPERAQAAISDHGRGRAVATTVLELSRAET